MHRWFCLARFRLVGQGRLPEGEHVRLGAGLEEADLECPFGHSVVLADELVETAVPQHAGAVPVDVESVRRARRRAVEEHAEGNLVVCPRREDEMRVARVEAEGDAAVGSVEQDLLGADPPFAAECPLVGAQMLGGLVAATFVGYRAAW